MVQTDAHPLRQLMQRVGFSSYRALSQATGVSPKQIRRLRQGEVAAMRLKTLLKLSHALETPLTDLLEMVGTCDRPLSHPTSAQTASDLQQEYERLQFQLTQQRQQLWQEFQQSSLHILEPLLLQLPTAAHAAQNNPQAPAVKLLPLLKPIDRLLEDWGIEPIAPVGAEIPYNPQHHQLMEGMAEAGDRVRVRYTGYCKGTQLLYRAKVSPIL